MLFAGCQLYIVFIALVYDTGGGGGRQGEIIVEGASENSRANEVVRVAETVIFFVI